MAPTELLAEQHASNFRQWFEPLGLEVGWLAGKQKARRASRSRRLSPAAVSMVVGTTPSSRSRCSSTAWRW
ncbi:hypothetical protein M8494_32160 [Serratia ureilytica]